MIESFTAATFEPLLHDGFRLESQTVELIEVTEGEGPGDGHREPFSIVFRGPREPALPQRIYGLEHAQLGAFELFLVPIGPDEAGMRYEAVFT